MKKLKFILQHIDGIWSVPLVFLSFWLVGLLLQVIFGYGVGAYDPSFIQPLFLAGAIVIGATNFAIGGLYFTFRGLYKYIYGERRVDKITNKNERINFSKIDWKNASVALRYLVAFGIFFYYVTAILLVYLKLV
jgi:hypothetical protein